MMQTVVNAVRCSIYIFFLNFSLLHLQLIAVPVADKANYVPSENIVLNCGSNTTELVQYDGRNWTGDIASPYVPSNADINSLIATAPPTLQSIPQVPYMTARIFHSQFTYRFNVTPGPKFIRLHFYPASYLDLNISKAFLSVTAGNITLLHNFSVSLNADYFNSAYFMKEFIVHVSGSTLELTFTPSSNASDAYAFVNGIEVISMPLGLYIRGDDAPLPLVGHYPTLVYIYNDSAMENLYRLNVGGEQIQPKYDKAMFRTWDTDDRYLLGANLDFQPFNMSMQVVYKGNVPANSAPEDVYRTSRSMVSFEKGLVNLNYNLTWFFPVDSGFNYLVRLHICEIDYDITKVNEVVFSVFLNNQTAEEQFDPIAASGGSGVAVYRDYVVMAPEDNEGKQDLWLELHPNKKTKPKYYNAFLNGLEIFKLSSVDKNLAGLNPAKRKLESYVKPPSAQIKNSKKLTFILIGCGLGAVVALPILLCLVLYRLKVIRPARIMSCCGLIVLPPNQANKSSFGSHFSLRKIKVATNDFDETLIIGTGGFGSVYKGSFDGGETFIAIKRANPMSEQGVIEFETEVHLLSQLRHNNLVSLLGSCNEDGEMILVYDFMANGTLPAVLPDEDDEHVNLAEWAVFCFENDNVEQMVDPNLEGNIVKECFELYLKVAMKCLAEKGVERPSIGDVLQNLVLALQLQKNPGTSRDGNVHRNDNTGLQGYSDLTPGVEFSEIMMPVGR
ncbi:Serine-threonine/tyrosine-protein kinase, catalytic domain [Sesbania bispinosa]|nr:Serine-threonine/tyrosine-protein kinase, catalytic domain [Sesbania bispinosa]